MSGELNRPFGPFVFLFNFIFLFHKKHKVVYCKFSSSNVFNVTTFNKKNYYYLTLLTPILNKKNVSIP